MKKNIDTFEKDWMWLESVSNKDYRDFFSFLHWRAYLNRIENSIDNNPYLKEQYKNRFIELIYRRIEEVSVDYNKRFKGELNFLLSLVDKYDKDLLDFAIKNKCFESFKNIIERYDNLNESLKKYTMQELLDTWLERLYEGMITSSEENKNFLLKYGAINENALKLSIKNSHLKAFKEIIEENIDLQKINQDINWKNDSNIQEKLNTWLKYYLDIDYDRYDKYIESIIDVLLNIGASKEVIYEGIKESIENQNFYKFKFFIVNFKDKGISIEILKQDDLWKTKLQNQLNAWLDKFYSEIRGNNYYRIYSYSYNETNNNINFLKDYGAKENVESKEKKEEEKSSFVEEIIKLNKIHIPEIIYDKEEMLKCAIDDDNFKSFKSLIKEKGAKLEKVKKDIAWNENKRVENRLKSWLKKEKENENKENIEFLLSLGAEDEDNMSNKTNISDDKPVQTEVKNNTEVDIQQSITENNTTTITDNNKTYKDDLQENVSVEQQSIFQKILNILKEIINFFKKYC